MAWSVTPRATGGLEEASDCFLSAVQRTFMPRNIRTAAEMTNMWIYASAWARESLSGL